MKKLFVSLTLAAFVFSQAAFAQFDDVNPKGAFFNAVEWMEVNGVINGYEDGTFRPYQGVNRVEFLKMLYSSVGVIPYADVELPFTDLEEAAWYLPYLKQAYADGVVRGYPNKTFKPGEFVNLAEAVKITDTFFLNIETELENLDETVSHCQPKLSRRLARNKAVTMKFVNNLDWYSKYFEVADKHCLLTDALKIDGYFMPYKPVGRGAVANLLYTALHHVEAPVEVSAEVSEVAIELELVELDEDFDFEGLLEYVEEKEDDEKDRFIAATSEVTCLVFTTENLLDPGLEDETKAIFARYGFDVENDEAMLEIAQRYEDDEDLQRAIEAALSVCVEA
jgi:hypothetical protein